MEAFLGRSLHTGKTEVKQWEMTDVIFRLCSKIQGHSICTVKAEIFSFVCFKESSLKMRVHRRLACGGIFNDVLK